MPNAFGVAKYSDAQRLAAAHAVEDLGLTPAEAVAAASAGRLTYDGKQLPAFDMPRTSAATYARRLRERRLGEATGDMAQQPPRDAVETLRKRLVNLADRELGALERSKTGSVDPERLRQTARAVREIAALPGPTDPTPAAPGARTNGEQHGGQTRGGLAGPLLKDHRATTGRGGRVNGPEQNPNPTLSPPEPIGEAAGHEGHEPTTAHEASAQHDHEAEPAHDDGTPGAVARALAARVAAGGQQG